MTPEQYGHWAAGLKLRMPMESAARGARIGGLLGLPVGAYRYFTSDDPSVKDALKPVAAGAALGGLAGGLAQHRINAPIHDSFKSQMTDWETTRGQKIFEGALQGARMNGSTTPFADASAIMTSARKAREKAVAEALLNSHGDNDVFKLRTHRGY
jgi:hypothetical protein